MTIRSPSRRLRLCILSLSLFCSGAAVGQSTGTPGVSSPPDIEVVSRQWTMIGFKPGVFPRPAISSETVDEPAGKSRSV